PVGAAVALALRQVQRLPAQLLQVIARLQAEDAEDRTHGKGLLDVGAWWWSHSGGGHKKTRIGRCGFSRSPGSSCLCPVAPPHRPRTVIRRNIVAVGIGRIGAADRRHGPHVNPAPGPPQPLPWQLTPRSRGGPNT